ncbi:SO2930 family diheme c-type cytochrome [Chitinophaga vietnamensis]|uniref:SO2930 family diheme c-type cytochrome n=1 Tax=Chitinophaga vietnamensis TaxID=2593957 RepID=UPI001177BF01|nr:SO2930 family diheme c-type cytochrome [Chitinophaga vietnamensis]
MRKRCILFLGIALLFACQQKGAYTRHSGPFEFKEKLSDYGFFTGTLKALTPRRGVENYELATPLFTDYAVKDRFIVLPAGTALQYKDAGLPDFPDSTFIVKNFAYTNPSHQKVMIETRILFKDPYDQQWKVMNYLWKDDQSDAVKWIVGKKIPITFLDDSGQQQSTTYQMPNTNDCKRCHINNSVLTPIGPKLRNLNFTRKGAATNQLQQWASSGILKGLPALSEVAQLPAWQDSIHFTVSQRARAYLDVNCAHCHIKGGDAYNTGLFLNYDAPDEHLGLLKSPVSAGGGAGGLNYDIIPGDAAHSILPYRMNSTEPGTAMPELARTVIHKEGVALITKWINEMKK